MLAFLLTFKSKKMLTEKIKSVYDLKLYDVIIINKLLYVVKHFILDEKNVTEDWRHTIWIINHQSKVTERIKLKDFQNSIDRDNKILKLVSL